jgi:hypothetical protein
MSAPEGVIGVPGRVAVKSGSESECSIDGCEKPARGHGWCNAHLQRWQKHGDPLTVRRDRSTYPPGTVFDRLTVRALAWQQDRGGRHRIWLAECECGDWIRVPSDDLKSGNTRSCGCLRHRTRQGQFA